MPCLLPYISEQNALTNPRKTALRYQDAQGNLVPVAWADLHAMVQAVAASLLGLGLQPGDKTAVFADNAHQTLVADFAAYSLGLSTVSIYSTSSAQQVEYILRDSGATLVYADTAERVQIIRQVAPQCPALRHIVAYGPATQTPDGLPITPWQQFAATAPTPEQQLEIVRRREATVPQHLATLIYTSGTTGEPKGAMLTHGNFDACFELHRQRLPELSRHDTSLCFLPLSHIFEKAWTYFCLYFGITVTLNRDPRDIAAMVRRVNPTCMCSVPRFWEKAYSAIQQKLAAAPLHKRLLARRAFAIGRRRNLDYVRRGLKVPRALERRYGFYDRLVLRPLRRAIGVDGGKMYPTAGAPIAPDICAFFHSVGINVMIGYGLSETTATVTCFPHTDYIIGTVGTPLPKVLVRIGPENEIQVKGPTVMAGYYNKPRETADAFTPDGWFRTGDAGRFDPDGSLVLTERIKDLFKTSTGKYIAPQAIESRLGQDPFIEQVAVIGDSRKYVTALIAPAFEALKEYARQKKIQFQTAHDLINNSEIVQMISQRIERLQAPLANFEKVKKFTLLGREFTIEKGELTNTLKLRRSIIARHFAPQIEAMYA